MAAALSIITRSMRLIGAIASGETPTAAESADALAVMNGMLSSWRNQPLMAWTVDEIVAPVVPSQQAYTMGPGGDINTTRPLQIENARLRWNGVDYPMTVIDQAAWSLLRVKTLQSNLPQYVWPSGDYPLTTLSLWPTPTIPMEVIVGVRVPLESVASLSADIALPPGYEDLIAYGLAIRLAPEFGIAVSAEVATVYAELMRTIKRANHNAPSCRMEMATGRRFNIYAGI